MSQPDRDEPRREWPAVLRMERDWLLGAWAAATGVSQAEAEAAFLKASARWREIAVSLEEQDEAAFHELKLRLAFVQEMLSRVTIDEDTGELQDADAGSLFSALDYALRGSPGCVEPEEWQAERKAALAKHADYLDLGAVLDAVSSGADRTERRHAGVAAMKAYLSKQPSAVTYYPGCLMDAILDAVDAVSSHRDNEARDG